VIDGRTDVPVLRVLVRERDTCSCRLFIVHGRMARVKIIMVYLHFPSLQFVRFVAFVKLSLVQSDIRCHLFPFLS